MSTPISVLLERVHQLEFVEARQAAGLGDGLDDAASNTAKTEENGAVESQLWVDKYAPRVFTELLSDEVRPAQLVQLRLKRSNMHIDALWGRLTPNTENQPRGPALGQGVGRMRLWQEERGYTQGAQSRLCRARQRKQPRKRRLRYLYRFTFEYG